MCAMRVQKYRHILVYVYTHTCVHIYVVVASCKSLRVHHPSDLVAEGPHEAQKGPFKGLIRSFKGQFSRSL